MIALKAKEFLGKTVEQFSFNQYDISLVAYDGPVSEDWHSHEKHHLTLILDGGNLESRNRQDLQVSPGKIILYNKAELHRNRYTAFPSKNLNIEIDDSFFSANELSTSVFNNSLTKDVNIQFQLLNIYKEIKVNDLGSSDSIHSTLLSLFCEKEEPKEDRPNWVNAIREILYDRWDEFISLEQLSQDLDVHPVTVSKHFSKYYNCTLGEYMRRIKIEKALLFLKQGNKSLTEIAFTCGFSDQSHFIKTFKNLTGFRPKEFRKL